MNSFNVLWTGGWDSTYRVLELLLIWNRPVRPYYIVDPERISLHEEIRAMDRIRKATRAGFPDRADLLLPLHTVHIDAIPPDEEIAAWYARLESKTRTGQQYEWLARFARHCVPELELCVEYTPPPNTSALARDFIQPSLKRLGEGHECRIETPFADPAVEMFTYFRFPIRHLTKADMRRVAEEYGFIDIMQMTWFCLEPVRGLPCGRCRPCLLASGTGSGTDSTGGRPWRR